jgi:hypothetical protein
MTEEETDNDEMEVEPVHDPEGYVQERRLKDVFDSRKKVRERRLAAKQYQLENQDSNSNIEAVRMYRAAVENYLSELKPLIFEEERGKHIWFNKKIGTLTIELPVRVKHGRRDKKYIYNGSKLSSKPEPKEIELVGLGCLFQYPEPLNTEFEVTKKIGLDTTHKETIVHTSAIPFDHLDRIMNVANGYLSERGLELDPEEDTEPASI